MGKINVSELASILMEKHGIDKQDAQRFIAAMVEVIQDGIASDRLVKVKGLGTFKVVEVDARESVSVNNGERVIIDSHSKLTFTPDASMKELVNKPFSQFETVVLNEGVNFDDVDLKVVEEPSVEEEPTVEVEPAIEEQSGVEERQTVAEEPVCEEKSLVCDAMSPESTEESNVVVEEGTNVNADEESTEEEEPTVKEKSTRIQWLWIPIILLLCGLCFGAGYYLGQQKQKPQITSPKNTTKSTQAQSIVPEESEDITIKESPDGTQPVQPEVVQMPEPEPTVVPDEKPQEQQLQQQSEAEPEYKKYEAMDNRVRLGAYHIVGLDHIEKVKQGETLYRISRRTLGPGMECYVEVYNGINSQTPLQVGQEIKIPKLKMKDAARKKLNR